MSRGLAALVTKLSVSHDGTGYARLKVGCYCPKLRQIPLEQVRVSVFSSCNMRSCQAGLSCAGSYLSLRY